MTYAGHVEGNTQVGGPFTIGIYLSSDSVVTTSDIVLSRQTGSWASAPGDTFGESNAGLLVPASTAAGTYTLGVIVDENSAIDESNEGNNVATFFPVEVGGPEGRESRRQRLRSVRIRGQLGRADNPRVARPQHRDRGQRHLQLGGLPVGHSRDHIAEPRSAREYPGGGGLVARPQHRDRL